MAHSKRHISGMGQCVAVEECIVCRHHPDSLVMDVSSLDIYQKLSPSAVLLNVYDLTEDYITANDIFQEALDIGGAFHAGVEVYGREFSFARDGIYASIPRVHEVHLWRMAIFIGFTEYTLDEINDIVDDELSESWPGSSYDLLSRNCCSFSRYFCDRIAHQCIPDWVDRLARIANTASQPARVLTAIVTDEEPKIFHPVVAV